MTGRFFQTLGGRFFRTIGEGRTLMPWGIADVVDRKIDPTVRGGPVASPSSSAVARVMEVVERLRAEEPAFARAYLSDIAWQLGIYESRRLARPLRDVVATTRAASFDDAIAVTGDWVRYGLTTRSRTARCCRSTRPACSWPGAASRPTTASTRRRRRSRRASRPARPPASRPRSLRPGDRAARGAGGRGPGTPAPARRDRAPSRRLRRPPRVRGSPLMPIDETAVEREVTITAEVGEELTADRYGNAGLHVLATPALVGLFEQSAMAALDDLLAAGERSVGSVVDIRHLRRRRPGAPSPSRPAWRASTGVRSGSSSRRPTAPAPSARDATRASSSTSASSARSPNGPAEPCWRSGSTAPSSAGRSTGPTGATRWGSISSTSSWPPPPQRARVRRAGRARRRRAGVLCRQRSQGAARARRRRPDRP